MKLSVLVENEKIETQPPVKSAHGLSIYFETQGKKILLDVGTGNLFLKNAKKLGIKIEEVDILIVSHGHVDHGGGLKHFLSANSKATIYMHAQVQEQFYTKLFGIFPFYIGLDRELLKRNQRRITFIDSDQQISDNVFLKADFPRTFELPKSNKALFVKENSHLINDDFSHEIAVLVKEHDGNVLFSSCSHSGIFNIVSSSADHDPEKLKAVIGGFHLYNPVSRRSETEHYITKLAVALKQFDTVFYTCHCTGKKNMATLQDVLGQNVKGIHTGQRLEI